MYLAAQEVFDFLGQGSRIGLHVREGPHNQLVEDWEVLFDFTELQFFGTQATRASLLRSTAVSSGRKNVPMERSGGRGRPEIAREAVIGRRATRR